MSNQYIILTKSKEIPHHILAASGRSHHLIRDPSQICNHRSDWFFRTCKLHEALHYLTIPYFQRPDFYDLVFSRLKAGGLQIECYKKLLELAHVSADDYTVVLMQGSGTFGVESVLTSVVGDEDKLLIIANGAYGERMEGIAKHAGLSYMIHHEVYYKVPDAQKIAAILDENPDITHVSMVHSETTSGILNDIESVSKVVKERGRTMIVDAMSSFGGVDIPVGDWGIDFIVSSANKCIQGVPGFSFIIANKEKLIATGYGIGHKP